MQTTPSFSFAHDPVMVNEIVEAFATVPPGVVVDATLGGAGHTTALLDQYEWMSVLGIDRDAIAIAHAREVADRYPGRFMVEHGRFDRVEEFLQKNAIAEISGALFDLGVSSPQLDRAERGFSYRLAGPLDMRMDPSQLLTAATIVNTYDAETIAEILRRNADERYAFRIATAIVAARPILDTMHLASVVAAAIPAPARRTGGNPSKRTFQAIRIEVNAELDVLPKALNGAIEATVVGGRIAVLTYHSGEDRIVKDVFGAAEARGKSSAQPSPYHHPDSIRRYAQRVKAPRRPSAAELDRNPRAKSARLRVLEKVGR
jgi:16S rRNA (cytosine1402-N4)-methyltransferase